VVLGRWFNTDGILVRAAIAWEQKRANDCPGRQVVGRLGQLLRFERSGGGDMREKTGTRERVFRGMLSRRGLLRGASGGAVVTALGTTVTRSAFAQATPEPDLESRQMTFASAGGVYQETQQLAYTDPFAAEYGVEVFQDGPVDDAKIRAMAESGAFLYPAAEDGLFEPIDYSVVDREALVPEYTHDFGVGSIVWSYNIGYNTEAYPGENHPSNWTDVFDLEKFPGKRTFPGISPAAVLEAALMADGVDPNELYPLDVDRAFAKLDTIKQDVIWWDTNSESQQLFVDGEVNLGMILNGRAYDLFKQGMPIAVEWNGNIQSVDYFSVLKGAKNGDVGMVFIQFASQPEQQAIMANEIAYAPTNPDAFPLIDEAVVPWLSTAPENREKGILIDVEYWRENMTDVAARFTEWLIS
jgi:putative spermidine/putrescine transport system substrate-binding protein